MYPVSQSSQYDRVATMFSPDGRLYQVEYASKIVSQGTIGVAMKYKDGVLFGAEKKVPSRLLLPDSIEKMFMVDKHVAVVSAGLVGDARRLVGIARGKAQENQMYYEESIQVETLVKDISNIMQLFTQYGGMRPFGISFIVGGVDNSGQRLIENEPSGALAEYQAIEIGKGQDKAMEALEKDYKEDMAFEDGLKLLLKAIEGSLGEKEKLDLKRVEFAYIDSSRVFKKIPNDKLKSYLGNSKGN